VWSFTLSSPLHIHSMVLRLTFIMGDVNAFQGKVVKKKQDLHRQCEANRAYAHYRWS
jgi:small subunit ribosomal protein S7